MKTIKLAVLPFTFIAAAVLLGGCIDAESIEGDEELDVRAESASAEPVASAEQALTTTWACFHVYDGVRQGNVSIWWGHTSGDAAWACNNWISTCGNFPGGCYALFTY